MSVVRTARTWVVVYVVWDEVTVAIREVGIPTAVVMVSVILMVTG